MGEFGVFIPILALMIPVLGLVVHLSGQWLKSPVAQAFADRVRGQAAAEQGELQAEVQALAGDMDVLRREVAELQERLDFAERLLARGTGHAIVDAREAH